MRDESKDQKIFLRPSFVPFSKFKEMKFEKSAPLMITCTEEEWENSTKQAKVFEIPEKVDVKKLGGKLVLPSKETWLLSYSIPNFLGMGDRVIQPFCLSDDPLKSCFPIGRRNGQYRCVCLDIDWDGSIDGPDVPEPEEPPTIPCGPRLNENGQWGCLGNCDQNESCIPIRVIFPYRFQLFGCACREFIAILRQWSS